MFIGYVLRLPKDDFSEIFNELLCINNSITRKHSRILQNSKEHIIQMRILRAILYSEQKLYWSDELWQALFAPSNQLNISYFYECLVASQVSFDQSHFEVLMDKLQTLHTFQINQQDSIISVIYIYCIRNWDYLKLEDFQKLFELLYQQMIQVNTQTKFFMKLVLHTLETMKSEESR